MMIDNYAQTMDLMHRMEEQLPIPVRLDSPVTRMLRAKGMAIDASQELEIRRVFYFGDEGGIMCDVTPAKDVREAVVVSLTHLLVPAQHPLAQEIRAYQWERTRRIAQSGGSGKPSGFTVRPRKKRRR
jgi:hypothetical protein